MKVSFQNKYNSLKLILDELLSDCDGDDERLTERLIKKVLYSLKEKCASVCED